AGGHAGDGQDLAGFARGPGAVVGGEIGGREDERTVLVRAPRIIRGGRGVVHLQDRYADRRRVGGPDAIADPVGEGVRTREVRGGNVRTSSVRSRHRAMGRPAQDRVGEARRVHADGVEGEGRGGVLLGRHQLVGRSRGGRGI